MIWTNFVGDTINDIRQNFGKLYILVLPILYQHTSVDRSKRGISGELDIMKN